MCDAGFFCAGGATSAAPYSPGALSNSTGGGSAADLVSNDTCAPKWDCVCPDFDMTRGGVCPPGYFCPQGSRAPVPCTPGMYCAVPALDTPTGDCHQGYYCNHTSSEADQHICPAGHYCPTGTAVPVPCPAGTFSMNEGNNEVSDCVNCTGGMYCQGDGNVVPDGPCNPGYYCPTGVDNPAPHEYLCFKGHFCPVGTDWPVICVNGTYQANEGAPECDPCVPGYYCDPIENGPVVTPAPCPVGHYCPEATAQKTSFPCPAGTFAPVTHYQSEENCTMCPAGEYCESAGLVAPTGACYGGYYCTGWASSPTPINHLVNNTAIKFTGNDLCPTGFFCPNGTMYPLPCPVGTFSITRGLITDDECQPCPVGRWCNVTAYVMDTEPPLCDPGYVCTGGSTTPRPIDYVEGYPCPPGFYCPAGTSVPLGCQIGTFQNQYAQPSCVDCLGGQMCDSTNMTEPVPCKPGHYCPPATPPLPCPEATYNNHTGLAAAAECSPCAVGQYCAGVGNIVPTGPCSAGQYCQGGAKMAVPLTNNAQFPQNGPCISGHYCPEGTLFPQPCPAGMMRQGIMGTSPSDCSPCTAGFYCAYTGQSNVTAPCYAGFYCPGEANITVPDPADYLCPVGYFCLENSAEPEACHPGSYQPNMGKDHCILCPAGFYCVSATVPDPQSCPPYHYCPEGTYSPIPCPNGTYTYDNDTEFKTVHECRPCPAGEYCRGGYVSGECSAGYWCKAGADDYTPMNYLPDPETVPCQPNDKCAGPCPAGYYCPEGIEIPEPCPEHTIRMDPGGRYFNDCLPCPAGYWCHQGDPMPELCPAGAYCHEGTGPIDCPVLHYRDVLGGQNISDCFPCVAGYWCNVTGMDRYDVNLCPVGHYCPAGSEPELCPAGQMRSVPGAGAPDECPLCRAGYYCPNDTINVDGIPCEETFECPEGSALPAECRPGRYCPALTGIGIICPAGYYCPNATGSNPYICEYPLYCPTGANMTYMCPLGHMAIHHNQLRKTYSQSCRVCPGGTYGNHTERHYCSPCPAGYFCPEGTAHGDDNMCQKGYYCPAMSPAATPCPAGRYGKFLQAKKDTDCVQCPANTFANQEGQEACKPCGSSAKAGIGAKTCECIGKYRAYQTSDGACRPLAGYCYYDEADRLVSDDNSEGDAQPCKRPLCSAHEIRMPGDGSCQDPLTYDCQSQCGQGIAGTLGENGRCNCDRYKDSNEICNLQCREAEAPELALQIDPVTRDISVTVYNKDTKMTTTIDMKGVFALRKAQITKAERIEVVSFDINGIKGAVYQNAEEALLTINEPLNSAMIGRAKRSVAGRVLLQTTTAVEEIPNPLVCLELEEIMLFRIYMDENDRTKSHYPKYMKDHLYNTNLDFDYGDFSQLEYYITQTNVTYNAFAYSFDQPGTYVFVDSQDSQAELIVTVKDIGSGCAADQPRMQSSSPSNLVYNGIKKEGDVNQEPDWGLIIGLIAFLAACVLMLVVAVIVWRPRDAGIYPMKHWKPTWRSLGAPPKVPQYILYDSEHYPAVTGGQQQLGPRLDGDGGEDTELTAQIAYKGEETLDDFNVRVLFDKLEDQNLHLASQLARHQEDLTNFYSRMCEQNEDLKDMLNNLDLSKLEEIEAARAEMKAGRAGDGAASGSEVTDGNRVVSTTVNIGGVNKTLKFLGGNSREAELMQALSVLLNKLQNGGLPVTPDMLTNMQTTITKEGHSTVTRNTFHGGADAAGSVAGSSELLRRHNAEKLSLARSLALEEEEALERAAAGAQRDRERLTADMGERLANKLAAGDLSEADVASVMAAHDRQLHDALAKLSATKEQQAETLRQRLAERRRKQEAELRQRQATEAESVGLPAPAPPYDTSQDTVRAEQLLLELLAAQEAGARARGATATSNMAAASQCDRMTRSLKDHMDSLCQQNVLTDGQKDELMAKQSQLEKELIQRIEARKTQQVAALKAKLDARRKKKMDDLRERHEREKQKLSTKLLQEGSHDELARVMAAREKVQAHEAEALEAQLEAQEAEHVRLISASANDDMVRGAKDAVHDALMQLPKVSPKVDSVLHQKILDLHRKDVAQIEDDLEHVKEKQRAELEAKLAARRERRLAEERRSAEEAAAKQFLQEQSTQISTTRVVKDTDETFKAPEVDYGTASAEEQALKKQHDRTKSSMAERHEEERAKQQEKLDAAARKEEEKLTAELDMQREKKLREKKNKQAAELATRTDLTEEERMLLMASHEQELESLVERLDTERRRQLMNMREKLASAKRRKLDTLRRKQEAELTKESLTQRRELEEVRAKKAQTVERSAMSAGVRENGREDAPRVVRSVLATRHAAETRDLDAAYSAERKIAVDSATAALADKWDRAREEMAAAQAAELEELQKQDLSPEEFEQKRSELLNRHQVALTQLDKRFGEEQREVERTALTDWEVQCARAKLALKEKQYKEFAEALREFNPKHEDIDQAMAAAHELAEVRKRLDQQRKEAEGRLKLEQKEFESSQKKNAKKDIELYNKQLEDELQQEQERHKRNLEALNKRKEDMVREKKHKLKEELERLALSGASQEEQDQILAAHQRQLQNLVNKMDADKLRMQSNLQDKLSRRKDEKLKLRQTEVTEQREDARREFAEKQRSEVERLKQDEILTLRESVNIDHVVAASGRRPDTVGAPAGAPAVTRSVAPTTMSQQMPLSFTMAAPLNEVDLTALLMASPLYAKLDQIKRHVASGGFRAAGKHKLPPGEGYIDPRDAGWTNDTALRPADLNKISSRDFVVYKFGCFAVDLISAHCQLQPVTLLLADKIPSNRHLTHNAYRNSFCFDATNRLLYLRTERLDSVGQFILVLVHTLAHITAGDLRDDHNPDFAREFYRALSVVCDDLFFARYRRGPSNAAAATLADKEKVNVEAAATALLTAMFGEAYTEEEKCGVVAELLDVRLLPATDGNGVMFNKERIQERLERYSQHTVSGKLRSVLGDEEDKMAAAMAAGSQKGVNARLLQIGQPMTRGNTLLTRQVLPEASILSNMTGHAMWQTFVNQSSPDMNEKDDNKPEKKEKDSLKSLLESEVAKVQENVDNLNADFSTQSRQEMELKEQMHELEKESVLQQELIAKTKPGREKQQLARLVEELAEKQRDAKNQLAALVLKKAQAGEALEAAQAELTARQAQLNSREVTGADGKK